MKKTARGQPAVPMGSWADPTGESQVPTVR